jgi:hypothetical protein
LFRVDALAKNKSGKPAIIPGDPAHSEMIRRLTINDPDERMPYKHDPLSKEEIEICALGSNKERSGEIIGRMFQ